MLHVYINYPNPHMTIHADANCRSIRQSGKAEPRISEINLGTLTEELSKFADKEYAFAANPAQNDIWLDIDLEDEIFERAVAEFVLRLIGSFYTPLRGLKPSVHC